MVVWTEDSENLKFINLIFLPTKHTKNTKKRKAKTGVQALACLRIKNCGSSV